jgi:hypothetical protein
MRLAEQRFRKEPMTWNGAAVGGCIYVTVGAWLLWTGKWSVLGWIMLISGIFSLYMAWDLWREKRK